jgi:hypothetical protein
MCSHAVKQTMQRCCCPSVTRGCSFESFSQTRAISCRLQQTKHAGYCTCDSKTAALLLATPRLERVKIINIRCGCLGYCEIQRGLLHWVLTGHNCVKPQQAIRHDTAGMKLKCWQYGGAIFFSFGEPEQRAIRNRRGCWAGQGHAGGRGNTERANEKVKACKGVTQRKRLRCFKAGKIITRIC